MAATGVVDDASAIDAAPRAGRLTFRPPRLSDPRLHVASVVISVQVLGQVSLGFDLSIAQILVSLVTAAAIELALTVPRTRVVAWPASAMLTGNGIALILRVPGTEHGDWWSLRGWYVFAATAALGVLSKYVMRVGDRPLFNPSNVALVVTFLVLGSGLADPQDLWWGPMSVGLALTYAVVVVGGLVITRRLDLLRVSIGFWVTFAALMALLAAAGHEMTARWSLGPVSGLDYWTTLALSPEVLIFLFFMITDPRTAARGRTGGLLYAVGVAAASGALVALQTTEYATKVALLTGLVVVCGLRPLIERWAPATDPTSGPVDWLTRSRWRPAVLAATGLVVVAVVAVGGALAEPVVVRPEGGAPERPPVELRADQVPTVEVAAALEEIGGSFDRDVAERIVADTLVDVLVADRAVAADDDGLAAAVASGPFLDDLVGREPVAAPVRTFERAVVDVVRDPEDFQAQPRLAITVDGTRDGEAWSATYHVLATTGDAVVEREVGAG
ncbi:hypothetical protein [Dermatobacter hominis]|uniref:hypothetical protein n=1 Tax=Dermatobacter hominis TaxID=2884263 RepID=UPI001D11617A|nr:hypothetical protein [Dermatobacter hominis]UDY37395.1 hypothetical protein LH044_07600 [Dermatobacter hominis]